MILYLHHDIDLGAAYDRKEAKLYGEATGKQSLLVGAKLTDGCNIYLVDDVGTSMATKYDSMKVLEAESERLGIESHLVGVGLAVDREQVGPVYDEDMPSDLSGQWQSNWKKEHVILGERGEDAIGKFMQETNIPVDSIAGIREVVDFLFHQGIQMLIDNKMQRMTPAQFDEFLEYMNTYGAVRR